MTTYHWGGAYSNVDLQPSITLRKADIVDWARIYAWRIDPTAAENSGNSANITIEEHMAWFTKALADANTRVYVLCESLTHGIGSGRLVFDDPVVRLSISIDIDHRSKGYAKPSICELVEAAWGQFPTATRAVAEVLATNTKSLRAFANNGFLPIASISIGGRLWVQLSVEKGPVCSND